MLRHPRRRINCTSNHSDPRVVMEIGDGVGEMDRTNKEMVETESNRGMEATGGQETVVAVPTMEITTSRRGLINCSTYTQKFGI